MSYWGKILKNTVIMFAVGVALAAAAPGIAAVFGFSEAFIANLHGPLWNGLFFGAFGGIHAAVEPIINKLVGDKPRHTLEHKAVRTSPVITMGHGAALGDEIPGTKFQDKFADSRHVEGSFTDKVNASRSEETQPIL